MANIKKIVLDIDGKEIKLNVDQAKELRNILIEMWPEEKPPPVYINPGRYRYPWDFSPWRGSPLVTWSVEESTSGDATYLTTGGTGAG